MGWVIQQPKPDYREVFCKRNEPVREVLDLQKQARDCSYKKGRKQSKQGNSQLILDTSSNTKIETRTQQSLRRG